MLFSLTSDSDLLASMGWSGADVLSISFGDAMPTMFADHEDLGLAFDDNIDMLELVPMVGDAEQTIRRKVLPTPGTVGLFGLVSFFGCARRRRHE